MQQAESLFYWLQWVHLALLLLVAVLLIKHRRERNRFSKLWNQRWHNIMKYDRPEGWPSLEEVRRRNNRSNDGT